MKNTTISIILLVYLHQLVAITNQHFPKILWTYQSEKDTFLAKLNLDNLRRIGTKSGWTVRVLDQHNLFNLLIEDDRFNKIANQLSQQLDDNIKIEIFKLMVLHKKGGLWISSDSFLIHNLSWINQLSELNNIHRSNPISHDVLLFAETSSGSLTNLAPQNQYSSINFQSNIMLTARNSKLLKDWLDLFLITPPMLRTSSSQYCLSLLQTLLDRKEKQLASSNTSATSLAYYHAWVMITANFTQALTLHLKTSQPLQLAGYLASTIETKMIPMIGSNRFYIRMPSQLQHLMNLIIDPLISPLQLSDTPSCNSEELIPHYYIAAESIVHNHLIKDSYITFADNIKVFQVEEVEVYCEKNTFQIALNGIAHGIFILSCAAIYLFLQYLMIKILAKATAYYLIGKSQIGSKQLLK